jgi:hypothetical protein
MAHKPNHPKTRVTSSRTRNKGTAKTPVSGAKPSSRANRSKVSTAKVTSEAKTRPSGARGIFEKSNPKVTKGAGTAIARLKAANRVALPLAIMGQTADVVDGFQKLANHPFINNRGKGSKPTPSAGRRTNPNAAKPKPKLADIRGTSKSKFADLRGSSKPGGSAPAAARELPKPTPKPTVTKAAAPSPRKVAPTPAKPKPKAPAKAKPPAASKPTVAQTSGIGPLKSGDEYARKKGSLREQARKLREMKAREDKASSLINQIRAESRKRQGK